MGKSYQYKCLRFAFLFSIPFLEFMKEKNVIDQHSLPLLRELDNKMINSNKDDRKANKNELNLTIFYRNNSGERETFTCNVRPRHYVGPDGQEMLIVFELNGATKSYSLPLKTMVGDLFAFILHSVSLCNLSPDYLWNSTHHLKSQKEYKSQSISLCQDAIEVIDSQCTLGELLYKSKEKKIIAIRNLQYHLCALITNNLSESNINKEIITLLDRITEELNSLLKSKTSFQELEKVLKSNIFVPNSSTERWDEIVKSFEKTEVWQSLKIVVDHTLFLEMLYEMNRIVRELFAKKRVDLSENDKVKLMETAIFFDKIKEMRA